MVSGTHFIFDWDVEVGVRPGRPDSEGDKINVVFCGRIAPKAAEIILNNLTYHRFRPIPKSVYQMSEGAQLLYRQGLPFVLNPSGWRLTYQIACKILGYQATPIKFQPSMIRKYVKEIVGAVGWKAKELDSGHSRVWILKASKKERGGWWKRKHHKAKLAKATSEFSFWWSKFTISSHIEGRDNILLR